MPTTTTNELDEHHRQARGLMIFFALVFVAEGLGQVSGLINQPLSFFLRKTYNWDATQINAFLSVLVIPWVIKPIYGIVSDFLPLFGYRRKTYLFLANLAAVLGYLWIAGLTQPSFIIIALMLTSVGMAASSTLSQALMVENGKKTGLNSKFVTQQWLWFFIAAIGTSWVGGQLCQHLGPTGALHTSAVIVAIAPIGVLVGCWFFVHEEKAPVNKATFKASLVSLRNGMKSKTLWVVGVFIFAYNFSPGFGTPMYVHMTDNLKFDQDFIGTLGSINAFGCIIGALAYTWLSKRMTLKHLLYLSILMGAVSQGSFVLLHGATSAIALNLCHGFATMVALLASLTLAANACPDGAEGFSYALLMSINNLSAPASSTSGAWLYDHTFQHDLNPLIILSAAVTVLAVFLVPMLKLGDRRPGEKPC